MKAIIRFYLLFIVLITGGLSLHAATVPEPSTIIYGKVLQRTYGHEHRLTEGTLVWTLRDQNGATFAYTAELEDIKGVYSYRISIPHQALASGLNVDPSVIPLEGSEARYDFVSIQVNGSPAEVISSGTEFLKILQKSRAATHRIDLQVFFDLADTDGDGMPDWWEIQHGLDWQTADGNLNSDGDAWNNLLEYLNGSDPNKDDRAPSLHTKELAAYGESTNGVWLRAIDADTPPGSLVFTLASLPSGGEFHFNDGSPNGQVLETGDAFTQQELNEGRLVFRQTNPAIKETAFSVSLSDGVNDPHLADVTIHVFAPESPVAIDEAVQTAPDWWRDENAVFEAYWGMRENVLSGNLVESALQYFMGRNYGWTLWDERGHTLPVSLQASGAGSHFILGGDGADNLIGSPQDDIISGGRGANRLRGNAGRDLFIVTHSGSEIIEDFNPLEDVLDLGSLVRGKSGWLNAFFRASYDGTNTEIRVNQSGIGNTFTDAVIRLEGVELDQDDLNRLWSQGQLLIGSLQGFAAISIEGVPVTALEEGYSTANLSVRRNGPLNQPLTVSLLISGSATNGVDYETLPTSITFGVGKNSVPLVIKPLVDGAAEFQEQLNISVATGTTYVLGQPSSGQIGIIDAKQRFSIVPVDQFVVAGEDAGYFRIVRQGPRSGVVELLLSFSGTAVRDVDYSAIPSLVTFSDQQASKLVPVQALKLGALAGDEKSKVLTVTIRTPFENEYLLGNPSSASMRLLSEMQNFEQWAVEEVAGASGTTDQTLLTQVASPRTGLNALLEYASSYGLNLNDGVTAEERELITPKLARDAGGWHFEFTKRLNDPRLEYVVERSADMVVWHSDPALFTPMPLALDKENAGRVRYRVVEPENGPLPFMRVRVNLKD